MSEIEEITIDGEQMIWAKRNDIKDWHSNQTFYNYSIKNDTENIKRHQHAFRDQDVNILRYARSMTPPHDNILMRQEETYIDAQAQPITIIRDRMKTLPSPTFFRVGNLIEYFFNLIIRLTVNN